MSLPPTPDFRSSRGFWQRVIVIMNRARRGVLIVAAGLVLLLLASRLDPGHKDQVARDEEAARARLAHEAKLAALDKKPAAAPPAKTVSSLNFTQLSFVPARDPVDAMTGQPHYLDQAPPAIKALDGQHVRIRGYLLPVHMEGNEVREFQIMAGQMTCCYFY